MGQGEPQGQDLGQDHGEATCLEGIPLQQPGPRPGLTSPSDAGMLLLCPQPMVQGTGRGMDLERRCCQPAGSGSGSSLRDAQRLQRACFNTGIIIIIIMAKTQLRRAQLSGPRKTGGPALQEGGSDVLSQVGSAGGWSQDAGRMQTPA